jgi:enoyl-CoA hydratase/carnithine racemase
MAAIMGILPRLVGYGRAADVLISGRVVLGAEAASIGLVERVSAPGQVLMAAIKVQLRRDAGSSLDGSSRRNAPRSARTCQRSSRPRPPAASRCRTSSGHGEDRPVARSI